MKPLVSGKADLEKEYEIVFLFAALPYFRWVAEILVTENFEINVFGKKEEPRSSGQVTALFVFEHSAFFYLRL